MATGDVTNEMQLLELIYRPQHYYVFHLDNRADTVREDLLYHIERQFPGATNIRVLPKHRSFKASWGSFLILRAELEGFEELVRMGVWDFSFIISASDLPLRSVDDMAAMLAPYRGHSFTRLNKVIDPHEDLGINVVWHACEEHLFNVMPRLPRNESVISHSAWVLLARDFVELSISENRPTELSRLHFYLMSSLIPDETYLGTLLQHSSYRSTNIYAGLHFMKPFEGMDINALCRHSDETDTCGQGPGRFNGSDDLTALLIHSHKFFFARKFNTEVNDTTRVKVIENYVKDVYHVMMAQFITDTMLMKLAELALDALTPRAPGVIVASVDSWRVFPAMKARDPCCAEAQWRGASMADDFRLWVDYTVINPDKGTRSVRASFIPSTPKTCYSEGHIRMMHLTTRGDVMSKGRPESMKIGVPIPTAPAGGDTIWLHLWFHLGTPDTYCITKSRNMVQQTHAYFHKFPREMDFLFFDVTVSTDRGRLCFQDLKIDLLPVAVRKETNSTIFTHPIRCRGVTLHPGKYTVVLKQVGVENPFYYTQSIHLVNEQPTQTYQSQVLPLLPSLWDVEDVMYLNDNYDHFYEATTLSAPTTPRTLKSVQEENHGFNSLPVPAEDEDTPTNQRSAIEEIRDFHIEWQKRANELRALRHPVMKPHVDRIPVDFVRDSIDVAYYFLFGATVVGSLFIYNLCISKQKSLLDAARRVAFNPRHLALVAMVMSVQIVFYQLGRSGAPYWYPHFIEYPHTQRHHSPPQGAPRVGV